jgi:predicted nucleic acid-binding protein
LIVVSDTSPILSLARISRLDLLRVLYQQVLIPSSVYQELRASSSQPLGHIDFDAVQWLIVATPRDRRPVEELREDLDLGEAEAIVLATERRADLLLIDERRGRRVAHASGLAITGLLGVVAQAKRAGLIAAARPVLDDLIRIARFWIGPDLYAEVLTQLGEI